MQRGRGGGTKTMNPTKQKQNTQQQHAQKRNKNSRRQYKGEGTKIGSTENEDDKWQCEICKQINEDQYQECIRCGEERGVTRDELLQRQREEVNQNNPKIDEKIQDKQQMLVEEYKDEQYSYNKNQEIEINNINENQFQQEIETYNDPSNQFNSLQNYQYVGGQEKIQNDDNSFEY